MLEANKSRWFQTIFEVYNRNLLKRRFQSLRVSNLNSLINKDAERPLIIYANHSSWWDGLVILEMLRKLDFENYVMMEEKQLRKLFLFRKLGAFSVVRENSREAMKSINYAADLLNADSNRMLLIFPQAEILPNDFRPLHFYTGLARIIQKVKKCSVVPAALRYEFLGNYKPEIYVKIGKIKNINPNDDFNPKSSTVRFAEQLTDTLDKLKQDIILNNRNRYVNLF